MMAERHPLSGTPHRAAARPAPQPDRAAGQRDSDGRQLLGKWRRSSLERCASSAKSNSLRVPARPGADAGAIVPGRDRHRGPQKHRRGCALARSHSTGGGGGGEGGGGGAPRIPRAKLVLGETARAQNAVASAVFAEELTTGDGEAGGGGWSSIR